MSTVRANAILDASGGNTATINSMTPTADSLQGFRNRLINGAMVIDQRNAGAATANTINSFTLDRWAVFQSTTQKLIAQQNAGSVTPPTGFSNYLGITSQSAYSVGSGDYYFIEQPIEGFNTADLAWGTANAKTVTLSFWVRSSLTGTFGGAFRNSAGNRSYPFSYTISAANTWEYETITVAGDTTGTWVGATNGIGIGIRIGLGAGSTFSGTAGAWAAANLVQPTSTVSVVGTNGATFYITGVQLEVGSVATPFERRPYRTELQLCQRYYYKAAITGAGSCFGSGFAYSTTSANVFVPFPVPLRTRPTALSQSGTAGDYRVLRQGTNVTCSAVPTFDEGDTFGANVSFPVSSGLTAGEGVMGRSVNTSAFLAWSAEL
jgi:hypothetical protein